MSDEKLNILLTYLEAFIEFLEEHHEELFGNHLYETYDEFDDEQFDQTIRFQINDIDNTLLADSELFQCDGDADKTSRPSTELKSNFSDNFKTIKPEAAEVIEMRGDDDTEKSEDVPLSFYFSDEAKTAMDKSSFFMVKMEEADKEPKVLLANDETDNK
jgi:MRG